MKTITKFINKQIHTDIRSWMVYNIDEVAGTAKAIEVEKKIKPTMVPGGFAGHASNLDEEFRKAAVVPVDGAEEFDIKRDKNGDWGFIATKVHFILPLNAVSESWLEDNKNLPGLEIKNNYVIIYDLTSTGRKKMRWNKLGKLEDTCNYFYDYNF
jgi:hypothetical protein